MTTSPVVSINDELLADLEAAADAATPQDLDSAEEAIKADPGAMIECPVCGGEGYASVENDYCNFDNHAIGVQFYGIGPEFGAAERYYRRANPATIKALLAHIADLKQQLVAAGIAADNCEVFRRDSERLDWLIGQDNCVVQEGINGCWLQWIDEYDHSASEYQTGSHKTFRAAIDAAMEASQ